MNTKGSLKRVAACSVNGLLARSFDHIAELNLLDQVDLARDREWIDRISTKRRAHADRAERRARRDAKEVSA
jgi:hypothetical protein